MSIKYNVIIVTIFMSIVLFSCSGGANHLPTDSVENYSEEKENTTNNTNSYVIKTIEDTKNISLNSKIAELEVLDAVIYSLNSTYGTNEGLSINNTNKIFLDYNNTFISATTNTIIIDIKDNISELVSKSNMTKTLRTLVHDSGILTKKLEEINIAIDPIQGSENGEEGTLDLISDLSHSNRLAYANIECRFLNKEYIVSIKNFEGELNNIKLIFSITSSNALFID